MATKKKTQLSTKHILIILFGSLICAAFLGWLFFVNRENNNRQTEKVAPLNAKTEVKHEPFPKTPTWGEFQRREDKYAEQTAEFYKDLEQKEATCNKWEYYDVGRGRCLTKPLPAPTYSSYPTYYDKPSSSGGSNALNDVATGYLVGRALFG